jgi:hypothetical protein
MNRTIERLIRPTWSLVALLVCLQPAALASRSINQEQNEVRELVPGQPVEREISGGQLNEARRLNTQGRYADPQLSEKLGQALGLCRELEDHYLQGLTLNLIGLTYNGSRQYDKAIEAYEQALSADSPLDVPHQFWSFRTCITTNVWLNLRPHS